MNFEKIIKSRLSLVLVFLLYSVINLNVYKNTIDDFAPKHVGVAYALLNGYKLEGYSLYLFETAPAYYTFMATLIGITGVSEYYIPTLPIEFLPYFLLIFTLGYKLIGIKEYNILLLHLLFCFIYFSQGLIGTQSIFIWSHGIGEILFFTILLLTLKIIKEGEFKYTILVQISTIALILTSYDINYWLVLFYLGLFITIYMIKSFNRSTVITIPYDKIQNTFIFILIILIGYHIYVAKNTVLTSVISSLSLLNFFDTIYQFIIQFFSVNIRDSKSQLLLQYPKELTYIYILKYIIYIILITFGLFAIKEIIRTLHCSKRSKFTEVILIIYYTSIIIVVFGYIIPRIAIGHFAIYIIFYVVMFSLFVTIYVYKNKQKQKLLMLLYLILVIWLLLNLSAIYISQKYSVVHNYNYDYIIISSLWGAKNIPPNNDKIAFPDQLTFGWWFVTYCKINNTDQLRYLWSWDDIFGLYYGGSIKPNIYLPINYNANYVFANTGGWNVLKPFNKYREIIESNTHIKLKIYSAGELINIYLT